MFRELIFSGFKLFTLILFCSIFLMGQELGSILSAPFQICWESPDRITAKIASDKEKTLFIPLPNGIIKAIDTNKNEIWRADLGGEIMAHPFYQTKTLYAVSKIHESPTGQTKETKETGDINTEYSISALDTDSGISKWKKEYRSETIPALSLQSGRLAIILTGKASDSNGRVLSLDVLDKNTGDTILKKNYGFGVKQFFNTATEDNENIVALSSSNSIISFSILDGKTKSFNISIKSIQTGATSGTGLLLSNDRGNIYLIDSTGLETKFKIRLGARITSFALHRSSILISSLDNFIYSISSDGKQINWKKRFAGRIIEKPIIYLDAVIAYSQGDNSLYFLNYDNGKIINRITVADGEEIIGSPIFFNNLLIVSTSKSIKAFSFGSCRNFTAAER